MVNNTDANNCAQTHLFVFVYHGPVDHFFKSFNLLIFFKRFENDKYRPGIDENDKYRPGIDENDKQHRCK
jgi:hypothetical protein